MALPWWSPRIWVPDRPGRVSAAGLAIYQPVTMKGRLAWSAARILALLGGFRLLPMGKAPPREVGMRLAEHICPRTVYAVMRANHEGRYTALIVGDDGEAQGLAKVATTEEGEAALIREAEAIERLCGLLVPPVRGPRILERGAGILILEVVPFRPRVRPWELPEEVARSLGALARAGFCHGDAAPWNLLATTKDGFVLVDWEEAGPAAGEAWDLCHWLVHAHTLLGRPRLDEVLAAQRGEGRQGKAVRAYLQATGLDREALPAAMAHYLEASSAQRDAPWMEGAPWLSARRHLAAALEGNLASGTLGKPRMG